jgi:hypothetical protein
MNDLSTIQLFSIFDLDIFQGYSIVFIDSGSESKNNVRYLIKQLQSFVCGLHTDEQYSIVGRTKVLYAAVFVSWLLTFPTYYDVQDHQQLN